jgi:hypothetical protein
MALTQGLNPAPEESGGYQKWGTMACFITSGLVQRITPRKVYAFATVSYLTHSELRTVSGIRKDLRSKEGNALKKSEENLFLTRIDLLQSYPKGATGLERTRWSRDKSNLVRYLIDKAYNNGKFYSTCKLALLMKRPRL